MGQRRQYLEQSRNHGFLKRSMHRLQSSSLFLVRLRLLALIEVERKIIMPILYLRMRVNSYGASFQPLKVLLFYAVIGTGNMHPKIRRLVFGSLAVGRAAKNINWVGRKVTSDLRIDSSVSLVDFCLGILNPKERQVR